MEFSPMRRSLYAEGMRLTADDLNNQCDYEAQKRRLLNRTLLGAGVLSGLTVTPEGTGLTIEPGLALDAEGRELLLVRRRHLSRLALEELGVTRGPGDWWLCLRYAERACGEGEVLLPDDTTARQPNRMEESVLLAARAMPEPLEVGLAHLWLGEDGGLERMEAPVRPGREQTARAGRLELPACPGAVVRSQEVDHGLGPGPVWVELAWEEAGRLLLDPAGLLRPGLALAVELLPERGRFVAAVRPPDGWDAPRLALRWRAVTAPPGLSEPPPDVPPPGGAPCLWPAFSETAPGGRVRLRLCDGLGRPVDQAVDYRADGGDIDADGWFTAPQEEGLFTVWAARADGQGGWATALVKNRGGL